MLGEEVSHEEMADRYARSLPSCHQAWRDRTARRKLLQFDLAKLGAGAETRARLPVQLPRPANPVRPLRFPAHPRHPHRAAAGVLHACGNGPGAQRNRPRKPRHRVLQRAVDFRLHVVDPTLFNSGTSSQLSSCYLTTVADDLDGIYEALKENALLSKYAGGLGNDWTPVRALGSHIKGTNGKSQVSCRS